MAVGGFFKWWTRETGQGKIALSDLIFRGNELIKSEVVNDSTGGVFHDAIPYLTKLVHWHHQADAWFNDLQAVIRRHFAHYKGDFPIPKEPDSRKAGGTPERKEQIERYMAKLCALFGKIGTAGQTQTNEDPLQTTLLLSTAPPMRDELRYRKGDAIGGRYLVQQALAGGMGEVYLCFDLRDKLPSCVSRHFGVFCADFRYRSGLVGLGSYFPRVA